MLVESIVSAERDGSNNGHCQLTQGVNGHLSVNEKQFWSISCLQGPDRISITCHGSFSFLQTLCQSDCDLGLSVWAPLEFWASTSTCYPGQWYFVFIIFGSTNNALVIYKILSILLWVTDTGITFISSIIIDFYMLWKNAQSLYCMSKKKNRKHIDIFHDFFIWNGSMKVNGVFIL